MTRARLHLLVANRDKSPHDKVAHYAPTAYPFADTCRGCVPWRIPSALPSTYGRRRLRLIVRAGLKQCAQSKEQVANQHDS